MAYFAHKSIMLVFPHSVETNIQTNKHLAFTTWMISPRDVFGILGKKTQKTITAYKQIMLRK